jgi:hypothetical protein
MAKFTLRLLVGLGLTVLSQTTIVVPSAVVSRYGLATTLTGIETHCQAATMRVGGLALASGREPPQGRINKRRARTRRPKPTSKPPRCRPQSGSGEHSPTTSREGQAESGVGMLIGTVTKGPLPPGGPLGGGVRSRPNVPAAGVKIIISKLDGLVFKSAVTDRQGAYRVDLPAGAYRVTMGPLNVGEFTKSLPAEITIVEGHNTRLDILLDTGIR